MLGVALHPEGVDRNHKSGVQRGIVVDVALHPEGVDRNTKIGATHLRISVALHPEGVDRNFGSRRNIHQKIIRSPSTRRAWIEI